MAAARVRKRAVKQTGSCTYIRGVDTVLDDVVEETGHRSARQGRLFGSRDALGILQN